LYLAVLIPEKTVCAVLEIARKDRAYPNVREDDADDNAMMLAEESEDISSFAHCIN
jgi:hypothetical protein